jgi:hypothetical protein
MVLNKGLQIHIIKKLIKRTNKERNYRDDDNLDFDVWAYVDSTLELDENINEFVEMGLIDIKLTQKMEEHLQSELLRRQENENKQKYIDSLTTPYYKCHFCDEYITPVKDLMLEHLQEEHHLEECDIPPENPKDMTYIILDELISLSQQKEFKNKRYIVVTNEFLWKQLLRRIGAKKEDKSAPSNQKPRQILDKLGILCKHKYQRINSIGYTKKAKRRYCIYKTDLKRAVNKSEFNDLKYKFEDTP